MSRDYARLDEVVANPERGLYVQFTARGQAEPLGAGVVRELRDEHGVTLILRLYYLNEFRDRAIDDARLALIRRDMDTLREAGAKCILRFAYNERIGDPDAPIDVVLGHLDQLGPILREHADVIAVAQAGFVGSWGEWHASTNDLREPENARRIIGKWLEILPASRCVQVRTPLIKQMLVGAERPLAEAEAFADTPVARIGHHNDCFLATDTDMGTYQDIPAEKAYLAAETQFLPMGGETCHVSEFNAVDNAREELRRFHWSYLNRDYHPDVIGVWREAGFLEEIQKKLGYRLVLRRAELTPPGALERRVVRIAVTLANEGWAAPINPRSVELEVEHAESGERFRAVLPAEARRWHAGSEVKLEASVSLPADMPPGRYTTRLRLPDPMPTLRERPAYAIRLANQGLWDAGRGDHDLGLVFEVEGAASLEAAEGADTVFERCKAPPVR